MKPPKPVQDPNDAAEAGRIAADLLARRGYSRAELTERLERRSVAPAVIASVLERFVERGWIDEPRLAHERALACVRRGRGRAWVLRDLRVRGLGEHAEQAWEDAVREGAGDATTHLREIVRRKVERNGGALTPREFRRVYNALLRGGHDGEAVRAELAPFRPRDFADVEGRASSD